MELSRADREATQAFVAAAVRQFGDRLQRILLYGSKARGDDDDESDLDVLVVLRGEAGLDWQSARTVSFLAADVGLDTGVDVSAKCISADRFKVEALQPTGFGSRVAREGIILWPLI